MQVTDLQVSIETSRSQDIFQYDVRGHERPCGKAIVFLRSLHFYSDQKLASELLPLGISFSDKISDLNYFHPHGPNITWGERKTENFMRAGVGSSVLEKITCDAQANGAKAIFVTTGTDSMRSFLRKKSYTEYCGELSFLSYFYKLI